MTASPLSHTRTRFTFLGCWLLWAALQTWILYWLGFAVDIAAEDGLVSAVFLGLSCYLIMNSLQYYQPSKNKYVSVLVMVLIFAVICTVITQYTLIYFQIPSPEYSLFLVKSIPVRFSITFLTMGWVAILSLLWYSQLEHREDEKRKTDAEKLAREAELYNLRQQLQPHFLFNSLNSITALIGSRPDEARNMVHKLSDFLRGTLKKEDQKPLSLAEELDHLQLYLDIEKVRFGHRLDTRINADEICKQLMVPPLLLQPIVENAIKFGLYDTVGVVQITLDAKCVDNELHIEVQNPYDPATVRPKKGTGFGLSGVKRRLYLLFARPDLLETNGESHIFTTKVKIPQ